MDDMRVKLGQYLTYHMVGHPQAGLGRRWSVVMGREEAERLSYSILDTWRPPSLDAPAANGAMMDQPLSAFDDVFPSFHSLASYPRPGRWGRFGHFADDVCGANGKVWRPKCERLYWPKREKPVWLGKA